MRYQGGKSRIAKQIASVITNVCSRESNLTFVSLFCGTCSIESKVTGFSRKILNDKHEYLIALLNGVKKWLRTSRVCIFGRISISKNTSK